MAKARVLEADQEQLRWDMIDLDNQLPSNHQVRVVWAFVRQMNLTELYDRIKAREGEPGRPPPDPAILWALWLYATLEGVGSARQHCRRWHQGDSQRGARKAASSSRSR